jgi:hypothetical protein
VGNDYLDLFEDYIKTNDPLTGDPNVDLFTAPKEDKNPRRKNADEMMRAQQPLGR